MHTEDKDRCTALCEIPLYQTEVAHGWAETGKGRVGALVSCESTIVLLVGRPKFVSRIVGIDGLNPAVPCRGPELNDKSSKFYQGLTDREAQRQRHRG